MIVEFGMNCEMDEFISYMREHKQISDNTAAAYTRDIRKLSEYGQAHGCGELSQIEPQTLQEYLQELKQQGKKASTISRVIASMKAFFSWQYVSMLRDDNPAKDLKPPKIEREAPGILSRAQIISLIEQPGSRTPKELRDRAMLELLYATGIRVSELINLRLSDISLELEYVMCRDGRKERTVPFTSHAREALREYLERSRPKLVKDENCQLLFTNCSGEPMSRQGFWKLLKHYGKMAGLGEEITPHTFRHSFAAHMLSEGADIRSVQAMMGHSDLSSTQIYMQLTDQPSIREVYKQAHPRM